MKMTSGKLAGMKAVSDEPRRDCRRGDGSARFAAEGTGEGEGRRDRRSRDGGVQDAGHRGPDPARERDPARSGMGHPGEQEAREECRAADRLREDRLRQDRRRPAPGSARQLVGPPAQRGGRGLHQDPPLLHAVRPEEHQRHQARVGRAHRRRVPRERHPVLPRVHRLRRGRRREGPRVREAASRRSSPAAWRSSPRIATAWT